MPSLCPSKGYSWAPAFSSGLRGCPGCLQRPASLCIRQHLAVKHPQRKGSCTAADLELPTLLPLEMDTRTGAGLSASLWDSEYAHPRGDSLDPESLVRLRLPHSHTALQCCCTASPPAWRCRKSDHFPPRMLWLTRSPQNLKLSQKAHVGGAGAISHSALIHIHNFRLKALEKNLVTVCDPSPGAHCQHTNSLQDKVWIDSGLQHQKHASQWWQGLASFPFVHAMLPWTLQYCQSQEHTTVSENCDLCLWTLVISFIFQLLAIHREITWEYSQDHTLLGETHLNQARKDKYTPWKAVSLQKAESRMY